MFLGFLTRLSSHNQRQDKGCLRLCPIEKASRFHIEAITSFCLQHCQVTLSQPIAISYNTKQARASARSLTHVSPHWTIKQFSCFFLHKKHDLRLYAGRDHQSSLHEEPIRSLLQSSDQLLEFIIVSRRRTTFHHHRKVQHQVASEQSFHFGSVAT